MLKQKYGIQLNKEQEKAVLSTEGAILLLAVPGSGKTTVIVTKIGYLLFCKQIPASSILTLTFSVSAAKDMKERFIKKFGKEKSQEVEFRTIHSFCYKILKEYEKEKKTKIFDLITNQNQVIAKLYAQITGEYANEVTIKEIITKIAYSKNKMLTKEEIEKIEIEDVNFRILYQRYEQYKRQHNQMDFDDQLLYAYQILKQYPDILAKFKKQYQYINIDEAQDTSKLQHEIIALLVTNNIFMVGDEDQSIYQFRAAYPQALLNFKTKYPNSKILLMQTNYRSSKEIVEISNNFIKQNTERMDKTILVGSKVKGKKVKQIVFNTIQEQYDYVVKQSKKAKETLAILYRNNDSAIPLVEILKKNKIEFYLKEQEVNFFKDKMVKDIKDFLIFSKQMDNVELFKKIYYKINCGIRKEMVEKIQAKKLKETIFDAIMQQEELLNWQMSKLVNTKRNIQELQHKNAYEAIMSILKDIGYEEYLQNKENQNQKASNYQQKLNIILGIAKRNKTIKNFLEVMQQLEDTIKQGGKKNANIIISTIHASKGLEYDKVMLIDVIDGILPMVSKIESDRQQQKEKKEQYEEEVRLAYVAMTRAKKELEMLSYQKDYRKETQTCQFLQKNRISGIKAR